MNLGDGVAAMWLPLTAVALESRVFQVHELGASVESAMADKEEAVARALAGVASRAHMLAADGTSPLRALADPAPGIRPMWGAYARSRTRTPLRPCDANSAQHTRAHVGDMNKHSKSAVCMRSALSPSRVLCLLRAAGIGTRWRRWRLSGNWPWRRQSRRRRRRQRRRRMRPMHSRRRRTLSRRCAIATRRTPPCCVGSTTLASPRGVTIPHHAAPLFS